MSLGILALPRICSSKPSLQLALVSYLLRQIFQHIIIPPSIDTHDISDTMHWHMPPFLTSNAKPGGLPTYRLYVRCQGSGDLGRHPLSPSVAGTGRPSSRGETDDGPWYRAGKYVVVRLIVAVTQSFLCRDIRDFSVAFRKFAKGCTCDPSQHM